MHFWPNCKGKLSKNRGFDPICAFFHKKVREKFGGNGKTRYLCTRFRLRNENNKIFERVKL